jgi:hypothetical protein
LLREYLSSFMRGGVIHDAGRGWYSRIAELCALNEKPVARLSKEVAKAFPLLDFTCWSTEQLRSYGHLLLARFAAFIHTERDAMSSVAARLRDNDYDIHLNPRGAAAQQFANPRAHRGHPPQADHAAARRASGDLGGVAGGVVHGSPGAGLDG